MASRFDRAEEGCELGTVVGLVRAPTEIGRIPAAVWVVEKRTAASADRVFDIDDRVCPTWQAPIEPRVPHASAG